MATTPNFAATPRISSILVNTANTDTTGTTGSRPTVFTAGPNGSRVDSIQVKGIVANGQTQAADTVRLWLSNGGSIFYWKEVIVPAGAGVISATQANFEQLVPAGIDLPTSWSILASTDVGGATASYHVSGFGGDY